MINDLMNKIIKSRMPQIENYMNNPIEVQEKLLSNLIKSGQETIWGKFYDYKNIKSWEDFSNKVPINDYESLKPFFERAREQERENIIFFGQQKYAVSQNLLVQPHQNLSLYQ